jgi:hypothetical protein
VRSLLRFPDPVNEIAARLVAGGVVVMAAVFGLCLGCRIFAAPMRVGVIPAEVCDACNDIGSRLRRA